MLQFRMNGLGFCFRGSVDLYLHHEVLEVARSILRDAGTVVGIQVVSDL
jgi:hypothetical protein